MAGERHHENGLESFGFLCKLFTKVQEKRDTKDKLNSLFHKELRKMQREGKVWPVLRLFVPDKDLKRRTKVPLKRLVKDVFASMGWEKKNVPSRMQKWESKDRVEKLSKSGYDFVSDLGITLSTSRKKNKIREEVSIEEVNKSIDMYLGFESADGRQGVLIQMMEDLTSAHFQWYLRIILKDLKLGLDSTAILKKFHPDAPKMLKKVGLSNVCTELLNPKERCVVKVEPFVPFAPMIPTTKRTPFVKTTMNEFVLEEKKNGYKVLLHFDKFGEKGNPRIELYSDSLNDVSLQYLPPFEDVVVNAIKATRCIIEGEILAWDGDQECFIHPSKMKCTVKASSGKERKEHYKNFCFFASDILYLEQKNKKTTGSILGYSLRKRRTILEKAVKQIPKRFQVLQQTRIKHIDDEGHQHAAINAAFERMIDNHLDELVIKDLDSPYLPGQRSEKWVKLSPQYLDMLRDYS